MTSKIMRMMSVGVPLYQHEEFFSGKGRLRTGSGGSSKREGTIARRIFNSLSHPKAVNLLIEDYEELPFEVRLEFNSIAQKENGNPSNSVSKGLTKANMALNGKILRAEKVAVEQAVFNERVETPDGVVYRKRKMSKAAVAAAQKYGKII